MSDKKGWEIPPKILFKVAVIIVSLIGVIVQFFDSPLKLDQSTTTLFFIIVFYMVIIQCESILASYDMDEKHGLMIASMDDIKRAATGGKRLGTITHAIQHELVPMIRNSRMIRDVTFRTGGVQEAPHHKGIEAWVKAVHENMGTIECYDLILCNETSDYYQTFYPTIDECPRNFHLYKLDKVTVPFPNFTIFYSKEEGKNSVIIGWPFAHAMNSDLFIIHDQKIVAYFDGLFTAMLPPVSCSMKNKSTSTTMISVAAVEMIGCN